jgi:hypothetical protein
MMFNILALVARSRRRPPSPRPESAPAGILNGLILMLKAMRSPSCSICVVLVVLLPARAIYSSMSALMGERATFAHRFLRRPITDAARLNVTT